MITDRTLASLRTAASLALLTPGLSVTVEVEGRSVVRAQRGAPDEGGQDDGTGAVLPVCAFHRCVGRAHALRRQGSRVEMVGVPGDLEPMVDLVGGPDVSVLPDGVVRRSAEGWWWHLAALSLPADSVAPVAEEVSARTGVSVTLHADRVLDVTVAVTRTPVGDRAASNEALVALEEITAVATVETLVSILEADTDWDAAAERIRAVTPVD